MTITQITTADLAQIVAALVRQGVTFKAAPSGDGLWIITLTGGF